MHSAYILELSWNIYNTAKHSFKAITELMQKVISMQNLVKKSNT